MGVACQDVSRLNDGTTLTEVLVVVNGEDPEGRLVHGVGVNYISLVHVDVNHPSVQSPVTNITKHLLLPQSTP